MLRRLVERTLLLYPVRKHGNVEVWLGLLPSGEVAFSVRNSRLGLLVVAEEEFPCECVKSAWRQTRHVQTPYRGLRNGQHPTV